MQEANVNLLQNSLVWIQEDPSLKTTAANKTITPSKKLIPQFLFAGVVAVAIALVLYRQLVILNMFL